MQLQDCQTIAHPLSRNESDNKDIYLKNAINYSTLV